MVMRKLTKGQRRAQRKRKQAEHRQKRRDKQRKHPKPWKAVKMKMFNVGNPMKGIPRERRMEIIRDIAQTAEQNFKERYVGAEAWFDKYDPLYILSFCATYFISQPEGIDPEATGTLDFPPFVIELLQALALTRGRTFSAQPLLDKAAGLQKDMKELVQSMVLRNVGIPVGDATDAEIRAHVLRKEMMGNTMVVRNWAYLHQMKRVCIELAERIDTEFSSIYGVRASRRAWPEGCSGGCEILPLSAAKKKLTAASRIRRSGSLRSILRP